MMKSINHRHFEMSCTPEKLKDICAERYETSYMIRELSDLVKRLTECDWDEFIDQEFRGTANNADVYFQIEKKGYEAIGVGLELISLVRLWRGRHELGDDAELIQCPGITKIGVMAIKDRELTVHHNNVAGSESFSGEELYNLARKILRSVSSINSQAKFL